MALREALDTAVESARAACDARSHTLTVSIENAVVRGDLHRLTQVFTNLLGNACKFTPPGGRIDLTATKTDGRVSISVRDTGVGIAPDVLPRIFDLFVQSEASLARSEGGLGLGLPIVKRIVEMHGGNVDAQSQGPGCGATFTVHLPLAPGRQGSESAVQLSVLVVEDNLAAAETLQAMLESDGHEVTVAHDGAEGLRLARELLPDVIILDIGCRRWTAMPLRKSCVVTLNLPQRPWLPSRATAPKSTSSAFVRRDLPCTWSSRSGTRNSNSASPACPGARANLSANTATA